MTVLSKDQLQQWDNDGYLVLPGFFSQSDTNEMLNRARELLDEFDPSDHPLTTFRTGTEDHIGDDYFLESGDKIRYFLEPSSLSPQTPTSPPRLTVPPAQSINKIGHALAVLDPVFRKYTIENDRVRDVARDLGPGVFKSPRVLQSMIICKQPRIGGQVPCHNDSTFLYTDPPSAVGCWIALEACTPENGCLLHALTPIGGVSAALPVSFNRHASTLSSRSSQSFLPGSHKSARISSRFVRAPAPAGGTTFEPVPGVKPNEEKWDEMDGWREAPCTPGTLVLIHGSVMHKSPPNPSDKSRLIYTFHMIEGDGAVYDERNWLQPTAEMPFPALF